MSKPKKYVFQLYESTDCNDKDGKKSIDIAPSPWITYDFQQFSCMVSYPSSPYTPEVMNDLRRRIQANEKPLPSWPRWPITLRGGANTYRKAEDRLHALEKDDYAYTTDNEEEFKTRGLEQTEIFRSEAYKILMAIRKEKTPDQSEAEATSASDEQDLSDGDLSSLAPLTPLSTLNPKRKRFDKSQGKEQIKQKKVKKSKNGKSKVNSQSPSNRDECDEESTITVQAGPSQTLIPVANDTQKKNKANANDEQVHLKDGKKKGHDEDDEKSGKISTLIREFASFKVTMVEVAREVKLIRQSLSGGDVATFNKKLGEMGLTIPLQDESSWRKFDDQLRENAEFHESFVNAMRTAYDGLGNRPTKSCTGILRMIFAKKLIRERFNPFRSDKEKDKIAFCTTAMYSAMIDGISQFHTNRDGTHLTQTEFHVALRNAFGNAKDWGDRNSL